MALLLSLQKLIFEFLKSNFENSKTKVNADATILVGEVSLVLSFLYLLVKFL